MPFARAMPGVTSAAMKGMGMLRGGYAAAGGAIRGTGVNMFRQGGLARAASYVPGYLGKGLMATSRSSVAAMGLTGALAGGAYGAVSSDTSVIGGALAGAGLAVGALGAAKLGRRGLSVYNYTKGAGRGRGVAAGAAFSSMGKMARSYFGSSYSRAANAFKAMK